MRVLRFATQGPPLPWQERNSRRLSHRPLVQSTSFHPYQPWIVPSAEFHFGERFI